MKFVSTVVLLLAALASQVFSLESIPVIEYDRSAKNKTGLKESEINLSCRFDLKAHPALAAFNEWKPTRVEWSYVMDPQFIKAVQDAGIPFVGTLNTNQFPGPESNGESFDGKTLIAPWMQYFNDGKGMPYTCANKPATLEKRIGLLKKYAEMNVRTFEHDDAAFNLSSYFWGGGCFCKYCMTGFSDHLKKYAGKDMMDAVGVSTWEGFDYHEYLKMKYGWTTSKELLAARASDPLNEHFRIFAMLSTREYFRKLMEVGNSMSDKPLYLVTNTSTYVNHLYHDFLLDKSDYNVGETEVCEENTLWKIANTLKVADALCSPQVLSPRPVSEVNVRQVRQAIALSYALGHRMLIPWDVWLMGKVERWYGTVEEYGDLYSLVKENAACFDGYRPVSQVVVAVPLAQDWKQTTTDMKLGMQILRSMMRIGVSPRYSVCGTVARIMHIPVNPKDFEGASAVVTFKDNILEPADTEAWEKCIPESGASKIVVDRTSALPERTISSGLAGTTYREFRTDNSDLMVFPRVKSNATGPLVVHLVNSGKTESGSDLWVSAKLYRSSKTAKLLRPGKAPVTLTPQKSNDGLQFTGLSVDVWGILVID